MKSILQLTLIITISLSTILPLPAADPTNTTTYQGKISGLFCHACASKVKAALSKLDGVTKVTITKGEEQGIQNLHIEATPTSKPITKDTAIKALGKDADSYHILSLSNSPS
ncbi:heavy-metal-associated domain-containing protein [Phragmitibacter flavus]|uniref:Heavy-metal-associated domain-containing protein n=1 Tax=Phragmitibacter flavus TaxID=2576071 RepID=A0A5R8KA31_9BACT|nr:heavy metal-associated domain-containing protein [Phragmitibacter flavus]TLD69180.1 heavy-metal-associated domain-containing protein [Phragmitibacter flavus]